MSKRRYFIISKKNSNIAERILAEYKAERQEPNPDQGQ